MNTKNILEITGLEKSFKDFNLGPLDLKIPRGYIVGFIGENGAGKTTTIKLLLGLLKKQAGSVTIFGLDFEKNRKTILDRIGFVFDELNLPQGLKIKHIDKMMVGIYSKWDSLIFKNHLANFKLSENKKIKDLSRGMKMKLSLAIALSHKAELLILDEATSGLDPVVREEILDILMDYMQDENVSILISSHILSDLQKIADYIAFIHNGKIKFFEEKDSLTEDFVILSCDEKKLCQIPQENIIAKRKNKFTMKVLLKKENCKNSIFNSEEFEKPNIEDIMLFFARGELNN